MSTYLPSPASLTPERCGRQNVRVTVWLPCGTTIGLLCVPMAALGPLSPFFE